MAGGPYKRKPADVYVILDGDGKPRYVGQSTQLKARIKAHHDVHQGHVPPNDTAVCQWLSTLDETPRVHVLQRAVPFERRHAVEAYWITVLSQGGADLLNTVTGTTLNRVKFQGQAMDDPEKRRKAIEGGRNAMKDPAVRERHREGIRRAWERRRNGGNVPPPSP